MAVLAVLFALLAGGIVYQRAGIARHRRQFAPPGRMVPVPGHRLHATCRGEGDPLVVLEAGIAASSLSWALVEPAVATFTRVCAYDRAGLGWSDPPATRRSFGVIVDEASSLIEQLNGIDRCVLVGHSFGSFVVRAVAMRHPERVAGLVLVDPAVEWLAGDRQRDRLLRGACHLSRVGALLAHVGVVRACLALLTGGRPAAPRRFVRLFGSRAAGTLSRLVGEVRKLPPAVHPLVQAHWCQPKCFHAMREHLQTLQREGRAMAAVTVLPYIPTVVISSAEQPPAQIEAQRRLAGESPGSRHVIARQGAHWVQFDDPETVVEAVRALVVSARQGRI